MDRQKNRWSRTWIVIGTLGMNGLLLWGFAPEAKGIPLKKIDWKVSVGMERGAIPKPSRSCQTLPKSCEIVRPGGKKSCPKAWYIHTAANDLKSCFEAAHGDPNFSDYTVCSRLYRNLHEIGELRFTRQFGETFISAGSCAAPQALPECSALVPIPAGSFCRCPNGSKTLAVGYEPIQSGSPCLSTSIAEQCELRG